MLNRVSVKPGLLHLDLKPSNIQINSSEEVFLCDWGVSKIINTDVHDKIENFNEVFLDSDLLNDITIFGQVKGTPGFLAPEQILQNKTKGTYTDIYSLGAILYNILTFHPPLEGKMKDVLELTLAGRIIPPKEAAPQMRISDSLNAIVMKAMSLDAGKRYTDVNELQRDLDLYFSGFPVIAENANLNRICCLFFKRNGKIVTVIFISLIFVFIFAAISIRRLKDNTDEVHYAQDVAERSQRASELALEQSHIEEAYRQQLINSFSGDLKDEALKLRRALIYLDPIKALDLSIHRLQFLNTTDRAESSISWQIGYCYFIMKDFSLANKYFSQGGSEDKFLEQISTEYEMLGAELNTHEFAQLISELGTSGHNRNALIEELVVYDNAVRKNKSGYGEVIWAVLTAWNKEWLEGEFHYDEPNRGVRIRGKGLHDLAIKSEENSGESPLRFLDLKTLDLRETGFSDLSQIKTVTTEVLDIRNTSVTNILPLRLFRNLKTLIISHGQYTPMQLSSIPKAIRIMEAD